MAFCLEGQVAPNARVFFQRSVISVMIFSLEVEHKAQFANDTIEMKSFSL